MGTATRWHVAITSDDGAPVIPPACVETEEQARAALLANLTVTKRAFPGMRAVNLVAGNVAAGRDAVPLDGFNTRLAFNLLPGHTHQVTAVTADHTACPETHLDAQTHRNYATAAALPPAAVPYDGPSQS